MHRRTTFALVAIIGTSLISVAQAQDTAPKKSPELKVLSRFVGAWHGKAVSTDASGKETTTEDDATMKWVLGNSYVEDKIGDTLFGLWTYDRDEDLYRCWYFMPGSHKPVIFTMKWNAANTSFSGKADLGNGVTMASSHRFIGDDKFEFSAIVKDASGKMLAKLEGTKIRN